MLLKDYVALFFIMSIRHHFIKPPERQKKMKKNNLNLLDIYFILLYLFNIVYVLLYKI
jgi:hypothetical protein